MAQLVDSGPVMAAVPEQVLLVFHIDIRGVEPLQEYCWDTVPDPTQLLEYQITELSVWLMIGHVLGL